jgi:hypothetical protein
MGYNDAGAMTVRGWMLPFERMLGMPRDRESGMEERASILCRASSVAVYVSMGSQGRRKILPIRNDLNSTSFTRSFTELCTTQSNTRDGLPAASRERLSLSTHRLLHVHLSLSSRGCETTTGTNHSGPWPSPGSSSPRIARWMIASLPGGGGGTCES